ncbi:MAG: UDP-3-O-(3-hydroxymyristoyl)glucosamine N-acyltransferase [Bacteroidales bacterium]|nr:UDP-3-O-(3-hydroxymyristoyl)glucosamine N-acyltransferase [Bacteroidales bacterium]
MQLTAREIADFLNGEIVGNKEATVTAPARIEYAKPGNICFFANPKYEKYVYSSKASIILVNKTFEPSQPVSATLIKVDNAYSAVTDILAYYQSKKKNKDRLNNSLFNLISRKRKIGKGTKIGDLTFIGKNVTIGKHCTIYPQVFIGDNVTVGDNTVLHPGVRVYSDCVIGSNCIIHSNVVIGADGFGFAPREDETWKKIPQTGNVIIEDDVELGANTTVDRATMGSTIIHKGVKLDDHCMIAHNVEVGENTVMAAQTGIAGSTHIGHNCIFGGQVGVAGHLHIAPYTTLAAKAGLLNNVKEEHKVLIGAPAFEYSNFMRAYVKFRAGGKKD